MPSIAQEAFAEGFADLVEVHGSTWDFDGSEFDGVASVLKPDDPRFPGSPDRLLEVIVKTSELPATPPARGGSLVSDLYYYRIVRVDRDRATGLTTFVVAEGGEVEADEGSAITDFSSDPLLTFAGEALTTF